MSASINPDIVTDGLVLCYDAANSDCYRGEPTTNIATNIFNFTSNYSSANMTRTNNAELNFTGENNAGLLTITNNVPGSMWIYKYFTGANTKRYTVSWFVKAGTLNRVSLTWVFGAPHNGNTTNFDFNLSTGVVSNVTNGYFSGSGPAVGEIYPVGKNLGNGWWQISYSTTMTGINGYTQMHIFPGSVGGTVYIGGVQVEEKPYPTEFVNGTRGGTVATGGGLFDLSNNNNHGDINRTSVPTSSFYTPNNRGGFVFDGNNDYSRPTISHDYRNSSALEVIFNSSAHGGVFPNSYKTIMGYRHNGNYSLPTIGSIYLNNTTLSASVITTSQVYRTATFSSPIQTNQTYHVVLNKDTTNGILQLFVNGVAGNAQTFDASTYAQWSSVGNFIGANILDIGKSTNTNAGQGWGNDYFNGNIYKISVYNDILTPQQILDNYRAIKGRYGL